jgi:formylglycine-generating enzyme required for sulfatase activity
MRNIVKSIRVVRLILVGFTVIFIAISIIVFLSWRKTLPSSADIITLARIGVNRNSDWNPAFQRFQAMDMVLVPAGCFIMGSTPEQISEATSSCERFYGKGKCQVDFEKMENPTHKVCFKKPFWIGKTEVTNRLYGSNSSTNMKTMYRAPSWPKETISWTEASQFCLAHNARLPTEAEWEYAARGPDSLIYPWGNEFYLANLSSGRLSPATVASVPKGVSWVGAFDMSGGVSEWVTDWYAPYTEISTINPQGPASGKYKIKRGGDWFSFASFMVRTSQRESSDPDTANSTIGFRCVRE